MSHTRNRIGIQGEVARPMLATVPNEPRQMPPGKRDLSASAVWLEDAVKARYEHKVSVKIDGPPPGGICPSGIIALDQIIGGFKPGQMYLVEGATGQGKSSFVFNAVMQLAIMAEKRGLPPVLFYSLEMTEEDMGNCAIAWLTDLPKSLVQDSDWKDSLTDEQLNEISKYTEFSRRAVRLISTTDATAGEIRAMSRKAHAEHGVSAIVCDYLGLIDSEPGSRKNREQEIGDASRSMRGMAIELKVPVVVLSQINRAADKEDTPRIGMARDSGRTEADAPVVIFVWPTPDHDDDYIRLYVMKNRFGQKDVYVTARFNRPTGQLVDLDPPDCPHSAWEGVGQSDDERPRGNGRRR